MNKINYGEGNGGDTLLWGEGGLQTRRGGGVLNQGGGTTIQSLLLKFLIKLFRSKLYINETRQCPLAPGMHLRST